MFHIVQENVFRERNYDMIVDTLKRLDLDYEICRFVPFIHDIEFTTTRKDVWCWGSVKMAHVAKKYGFYPGSMDNENHDFEVYAPKYGEWMLNHDGICMNFTDPLPEDDKWTMFFSRPTKDTKVYSGQVFMRYSWDEYVAHCVENNTANIITDETRVLISPLKEIYQEIRCWVVGGKVITTSQYKIGTRVHPQNTDHEDDIREFAQKMVDIYQPAEAFVIDICRTPDGFRIVEINCINCSGFYDMNFQKLVMALEDHFNPARYPHPTCDGLYIRLDQKVDGKRFYV